MINPIFILALVVAMSLTMAVAILNMWWDILIILTVIWAIIIICFVIAALISAPGESFDE